MQISELGEQKLLQIVGEYCTPTHWGDDGAIVSLSPGLKLVVTTDVLVEGIHFSDRTTSPFDVGWRSAAANLSDIAAMGGSPLGLNIGLSLPPHLPVQWVEQFYQGLSQCLAPYKTPILGGDLCGGKSVTVAITALGQVAESQAIWRSTAKPGDALVITGVHGLSRAGLELLLNPDFGLSLSPEERKVIQRYHQRPQPRLDVIPHLETESLPVSGMDSSDGLGDAIVQICRASGVGAQIERGLIPYPEAIANLVDEETLWEWVFYGGEDFELVLTLPPPFASALVDRLGKKAAIIGTITRDKVIQVHGFPQGPRTLTLSKGFQHFNPSGIPTSPPAPLLQGEGGIRLPLPSQGRGLGG